MALAIAVSAGIMLIGGLSKVFLGRQGRNPGTGSGHEPLAISEAAGCAKARGPRTSFTMFASVDDCRILTAPDKPVP